jgi:hypothetical protein
VAKQAPKRADPHVHVEDAFDPAKHDELAAAVAKLSPDEAAFFLRRLEAAVTKRKIQLTGYLVAMVVWLAGMVGALVYYGSVDGFVGWVFLVPFGLVGAVLWGFGRWAETVAQRIRDSEAPVTPVTEKAAAEK